MTSAEVSAPEFIITRAYRLFAEFWEACRQARYIGLCYVVTGVGKTVSARQYAHWDELETLLGPVVAHFCAYLGCTRTAEDDGSRMPSSSAAIAVS